VRAVVAGWRRNPMQATAVGWRRDPCESREDRGRAAGFGGGQPGVGAARVSSEFIYVVGLSGLLTGRSLFRGPCRATRRDVEAARARA
jgi:hypothetical protein